MTESSLPRSLAKSTQVGAIFLQCPHHGAKNLTKLTCSGGAIDDLKFLALRTATSPFLGAAAAGASSFSAGASNCFASSPSSQSESACFDRAPWYLVPSAVPGKKSLSVGYPWTPLSAQTCLCWVQSTETICASHSASGLISSASSLHVGARFLQWPH